MILRLHRAVEHLDVWSASDDGFSFVVTYQSPTGRGFRGRPGYVASWRRLHGGRGAIKIAGSPFRRFADAEEACNKMLELLTR
ncbi:hypothetical protein [Bradyrhizobium genosp. P]|uniref:hypothetical protein n=1 Tax=Bradyrhizobium genosp. P TaxID=83641 RepID=UPI003CE7DD75